MDGHTIAGRRVGASRHRPRPLPPARQHHPGRAHRRYRSPRRRPRLPHLPRLSPRQDRHHRHPPPGPGAQRQPHPGDGARAHRAGWQSCQTDGGGGAVCQDVQCPGGVVCAGGRRGGIDSITHSTVCRFPLPSGNDALKVNLIILLYISAGIIFKPPDYQVISFVARLSDHKRQAVPDVQVADP